MIDFPASPTDGQVFHNNFLGPIWVWSDANSRWQRSFGTAPDHNILVNPTFQVSQQNGSIAGSTTNYYVADQWATAWALSTAPETPIAQRTLAVASPRGSQYQVKVTVSGNNGAIDAGSFIMLSQVIEGFRIADLQYGFPAKANYAVLRFTVDATWTGSTADRTFCVALREGTNTRSFVIPITVPYNAGPKEYSFVIPPYAVGGAWTVMSSAPGMSISFVAHCGTNFQTATPFTWVSGNFLGTPAINLPGATSAIKTVTTIGDVGFYTDVDKTGVAPEFQQANYEDDLTECLRYWYKWFGARGVAISATAIRCGSPHPVPMRITPSTFTLVGTGLRAYDTGVAPAVTSVTGTNQSTYHMDGFVNASAGGMTLGRTAGMLCDSQETNYIAVNAR